MQTEKKGDKPTRKRGWSAIDTVILLLILAAIAGVIYRVVDAAQQSIAQEERPM